MNKARRTELSKLLSTLEGVQNELETLRDEEQEYYDNMPESLQSGDKGNAAETAISELDDAISNVEFAIGNIGNAQE